MNELDRTLRTKRPAMVTTYDARPVILMTAPYHRKTDLATEVTRLTRRGEVRPLAARPAYNNQNGQWEIQVLRLREPAPAWIKPTMIAGASLIVLAGLLGIGWWMLTSLTTGPLVAFLLAGLAVLAWIARMGRTPTVTITQNVQIKR